MYLNFLSLPRLKHKDVHVHSSLLGVANNDPFLLLFHSIDMFFQSIDVTIEAFEIFEKQVSKGHRYTPVFQVILLTLVEIFSALNHNSSISMMLCDCLPTIFDAKLFTMKWTTSLNLHRFLYPPCNRLPSITPRKKAFGDLQSGLRMPCPVYLTCPVTS